MKRGFQKENDEQRDFVFHLCDSHFASIYVVSHTEGLDWPLLCPLLLTSQLDWFGLCCAPAGPGLHC